MFVRAITVSHSKGKQTKSTLKTVNHGLCFYKRLSLELMVYNAVIQPSTRRFFFYWASVHTLHTLNALDEVLTISVVFDVENYDCPKYFLYFSMPETFSIPIVPFRLGMH